MSEKLEVGSIVEGKVVRVKPFGAIVSLGNTQGLVHISQVANSFVQDINDERRPKSNKPFNKQPRRQSEASANPAQEYFRPQSSVNASSDFEDKMKEWMKQANDRQTSLNKRANKRSY